MVTEYIKPEDLKESKKANKIVAIEKEKIGNGKWSKVYYKIPHGRKIYSIYCFSKDIKENGIDYNGFKAVFYRKKKSTINKNFIDYGEIDTMQDAIEIGIQSNKKGGAL